MIHFGQCPGAIIRRAVVEAPRSEQLLQHIDELIAGDPLDQLVLVNRSDSFTMIRVLVTLFNALAYSRQLKLYQLSEPVEWAQLAGALNTSHTALQPHYSGEPRITPSHHYANLARP